MGEMRADTYEVCEDIGFELFGPKLSLKLSPKLSPKLPSKLVVEMGRVN